MEASKYSQEELRQMARRCLAMRGDQRHLPFIMTMCMHTGLNVHEVERRIEELAK